MYHPPDRKEKLGGDTETAKQLSEISGTLQNLQSKHVAL